MRSSAHWRREEAGDLLLALHVQPGAQRSGVAGVHGEGGEQRLKLRLAAPAVDGKANAELVRFLAEAFGVAQRDVTLLRGATSRRKTVRIAAPRARPDRLWAQGPVTNPPP